MTGPLRRRRDCDLAMAHVLYEGLSEIRTLAYKGNDLPASSSEDAEHPDWQERIRMIADTLHHIPGYIGLPRTLECPTFLRRTPGAGAAWLTSLWRVRYQAQEEWLVEALQRDDVTVEQLLGTKTIRRIEQQRVIVTGSMPH